MIHYITNSFHVWELTIWPFLHEVFSCPLLDLQLTIFTNLEFSFAFHLIFILALMAFVFYSCTYASIFDSCTSDLIFDSSTYLFLSLIIVVVSFMFSSCISALNFTSTSILHLCYTFLPVYSDFRFSFSCTHTFVTLLLLFKCVNMKSELRSRCHRFMPFIHSLCPLYDATFRMK